MALTTRDSNEMTKRKREVVDLTGCDSDNSDDGEPLPKASKNVAGLAVASSARQHAARPAYQTPPSSSAPRASQSARPTVTGTHGRAERLSLTINDDDDDDVNELVTTSQDDAEGSDGLVFYGDVDTKIVGVRFYVGNANDGEHILMRREPTNPYDKNAIRVDNVAGMQIGHIPRKMAEKLAHFLDNGSLRCEGQLAGSIGEFDCPLTVHMYGVNPATPVGQQTVEDMKRNKLSVKGVKDREREEKKREAERQKEEKRRLAESRRAAASGQGGRALAYKNTQYSNQSGPGDGNGEPLMDDILEASERFSPRDIGRSADQYGMQEEALKNLPTTTKPKGIETDMLPYQLQGLKWLLDHEHPQIPDRQSQEAVQLWKRDIKNPALFTNLATTYSTKESPKLASGGILCDDMGLGKTLETIALIVADNEKVGRSTGPTLIVSPLSVMSNWSGQIATHMHKESVLSVYTYHGAGRVQSMKAADFSRYDVVITTYQTLANDYLPGNKGKGKGADLPPRELRKTGLYSMDWRRVILDEGHTVRNPRSKGAAAVTAVMAQSRWVLTGTPIVNTLKDLYCLLRFVGISGGLQTLEIFNRVLVRPLKSGDQSATYLLRAIMTAFTLRRRKEMAFIDLRLPKLDEYVHRISFTTKERERYDALNAEAKGLLKDFPNQTGSDTLKAYAHLLEVLLRMRQCCNHWQLCKERVTNLMQELSARQTVRLTSENRKALQDMLRVSIQSQEECPICIDALHEPVITTCAHAFGKDCISRVIETQHKCPMCRAELKDEACLVYPANDAADEETDDSMDLNQSSSKLESLMEILKATRAKGGEKTVIFSQWTRFLDVVQARLDRDSYTYCRLDGTMNAAQRDGSLHALEHDPSCTIMLASLGVCAVGLNLTAANQIILSDTWWAPAIEDQAVDRVHRLGQKRQTRVFRLVMDDSIEEQTLVIQKDKRKLMRLAFAERDGKRDQAKAGRLADIQKLLGVNERETHGGQSGSGGDTATAGGSRKKKGSKDAGR